MFPDHVSQTLSCYCHMKCRAMMQMHQFWTTLLGGGDSKGTCRVRVVADAITFQSWGCGARPPHRAFVPFRSIFSASLHRPLPRGMAHSQYSPRGLLRFTVTSFLQFGRAFEMMQMHQPVVVRQRIASHNTGAELVRRAGSGREMSIGCENPNPVKRISVRQMNYGSHCSFGTTLFRISRTTN